MRGRREKNYMLTKFSTRTLVGERLINVAPSSKNEVILSAKKILFKYLLTFWFIKN